MILALEKGHVLHYIQRNSYRMPCFFVILRLSFLSCSVLREGRQRVSTPVRRTSLSRGLQNLLFAAISTSLTTQRQARLTQQQQVNTAVAVQLWEPMHTSTYPSLSATITRLRNVHAVRTRAALSAQTPFGGQHRHKLGAVDCYGCLRRRRLLPATSQTNTW